MKRQTHWLVWALPLILVASIAYLVKRDGGLTWPPSLDFTGGVRLEYQIDPQDAVRKGLDTSDQMRDALERGKEVFLFRLRRFDLSEITVKPVGDDRLVLEVPGTKAIEQVKSEIGNAAVLTFRLVLDDNVVDHNYIAELPEEERDSYFYFQGQNGYLKVGEPLLDAADISYSGTRAETASPSLTSPNPTPHIRLALRAHAKDRFAEITTQYFEKRLAVCLDQTIVSSPQIAAKGIREPIITGKYEKTEAEDFAKILRAGPLPVALNLVSEVLVSPNLGKDTYARGLWALISGLIFVAVILGLAYSDRLEMLATFLICLVMEGVLIFLLGQWGWLTLNMISLSGVIVLMGISVDNLILIFEEFRSIVSEEVRFRLSDSIQRLQVAFRGEMDIILLANATTGLVLLPLLLLQGPITDLVAIMILGIGVALLTNIWYARHLLATESFVRPLDGISTSLRPILSVKFDIFAANRGLFAIYMIAAAAAVVMLANRGLERGLDFKGGTEIVLLADKGIDTENLRTYASEYFGERSEVKRIIDPFTKDEQSFQYVLHVPRIERLEVDADPSSSASAAPDETPAATGGIPTAEGFAAYISSELPMAIRLASVDLLGANVAALNRAVVVASIAIALVILVMLMSWRYEFSYVVPVILALMLDGLIVLGAVSLFKIPLSLPVVAAVLTVVGYSINDSIVLCGHIYRDLESESRFRNVSTEELEEIRTNPTPKLDEFMAEIVRKLSPRILLTTLTTAAVAASLAIFGLGLLRDFGLVIVVGVIFGTISSVTLVTTMLKRSHQSPLQARAEVALRSRMQARVYQPDSILSSELGLES